MDEIELMQDTKCLGKYSTPSTVCTVEIGSPRRRHRSSCVLKLKVLEDYTAIMNLGARYHCWELIVASLLCPHGCLGHPASCRAQ